MPATAQRVDYISISRSQVVQITPPTEVYDQHGGKRVADPGYRVRFNNGRASVPADKAELLEQTPAFTGKGGRKRVFRADDALNVKRGSGPQIVSGAIGAPGATQRPPTETWNQDGVMDLARRIRAGEIQNLDQALEYEMGPNGKRRKTVVRAITDTMLDGEEQPEYAKGGERTASMPDTPDAEAPEGEMPEIGGM